MAEQTIPRDEFSTTRRAMKDNPGAFGAGSTVHISDLLGNVRTWVVETFRHDGQETVLLAWNDTEGGKRLVLPPPVMRTLYAHREQLVARARRRTARATVAMRRERGDKLGNPEALKAARSKPRRKRGR